MVGVGAAQVVHVQGDLRVIDEALEELARMITALRAIDGLQVFDSAANFVLLRVPDGDRGAGDRFAHLLRQGILVKNMTAFHPMLRGCLRVTVGTAEENAAFLDAMKQSVE